MERSAEIGGLISALAKAQSEYGAATKDVTNNAFGSGRTYKYADLAANINAIRPALSKNGIALMQFNETDLERQTARVTTSLHHGEQFISESAEAPAAGRNGFDVQSIGACWTYLRRYTLQALCGMAAEDDDASELAGVSNKPIPKPQPKPQAGPTEDDFKMWLEAFTECATLEQWNSLIVPMAKERIDHPQYGRQFVVAMAEEAKKRGYVGDRATGLYKFPAAKPGPFTKSMPSSASIDVTEEAGGAA